MRHYLGAYPQFGLVCIELLTRTEPKNIYYVPKIDLLAFGRLQFVVAVLHGLLCTLCSVVLFRLCTENIISVYTSQKLIRSDSELLVFRCHRSVKFGTRVFPIFI
jgi:hypothetical protein